MSTQLAALLSAQLPDAVVRTLLTLAFGGLVVVAAWLMRRSWNRKAANLSDLPALPAPTGSEPLLAVEGRYLGSTVAGQWLNRVVAQGLGAPSRALLRVTADGVEVARSGTAEFLIPRQQVSGVRTDRAIAGKAYERDGIVVVTWQHGEHQLDTGFRADSTEEHLRLIAALGEWKNA